MFLGLTTCNRPLRKAANRKREHSSLTCWVGRRFQNHITFVTVGACGFGAVPIRSISAFKGISFLPERLILPSMWEI